MFHPPVIFASLLLGIGLTAVAGRHPWLVALPAAALLLTTLRRRPRVVPLPEQVAALLRASGWRQVEVLAPMGALGTDITGTAPDGRRWVVRCHRDAATLDPADIQRFADAAHQMRRADVHALFTAAPVTAPARAAARHCRTMLLTRADLTTRPAKE